MKIRLVYASLAMAAAIGIGGASIALAQDATPMPADHAAHHPAGDASQVTGATPMTDTTASPVSGTMPMTGTDMMAGMGNMGDMMANMQEHIKSMEDMMAQMQGMEMSPDMKSMMDQMQGMMDDMMKNMPMNGMPGTGDMANMQEHMKSMEDMMAQMQGMMDDMMKNMPMNGMPGTGDMANMQEHMKSMQDMAAQMQGMEMSPDMKSMMDEMQGTMDDMMKNMPMAGTSGTEQTGGMASMPGMSQSGGMAHMSEPIPSANVPAASQTVGGQPLAPEEVDGVKVFNLTAEPVIWNITDNVTVTAWTYNGTVPGPMLRATAGDKVRVVLKNALPEATTIHWHGIDVPNAMDGVPDMPTPAIQSGEAFTYEFTVKTPGSYMYHSHTASDKQVSIGLYAPFIIEPATPEVGAPAVDASLMLSEWRVVDGQTYPAMPMAGSEPNYFTINGKSFPSTETIKAKVGARIRLRLMNIGQFVHPIHVHGAAFKVVATDGHPVPEAAQLTKDTIAVAPGERYDIEFTFTEPGQWVVHCHILHHTTNDGVDGGGMMLAIDVAE